MRSPSSPLPPPSRRPLWFLWVGSFLAWTVIATLFLVQLHIYHLVSGKPPVGGADILRSLLANWLWGLLTPCILLLVERWPLERERWRRHLGLHLVAAFAAAAVDAVSSNAIDRLVDGSTRVTILGYFATYSFINVIAYAAVAGVGMALRHNRLLAERRMRESELEAQLLQARLQALEMQLRPHFLFNALHTVGGLIRTQQYPAAVQMVAGLGDLLRAMLRSEGAQLVPLRQELAFIEKYLGIEQVRFQDRLRTHIQAAPEVLDVLVPSLILQPLVENAVRHGIEAREGAGEVFVVARPEGERLWLEVRDTGVGLNGAAEAPSRGIGLGNTRERLRHLYGEQQHFELCNEEGGGALARVGIPLPRPVGHALEHP